MDLNLLFRVVKIADIGYITTLYFFVAFFLSIGIDHTLGTFDPKSADAKSTARLFAECILHVFAVGVITYIVRNIAELVPSPFDGIAGLIHARVKELGNASVFVFIFLFFQQHLRDKLTYLSKRLL